MHQSHSPALAKAFFSFRKATLAAIPDISLFAANLYELYRDFGTKDGLDYTSENGNRIVLRNAGTPTALKRTTVYFQGKNNTIELDDLKKVHRLDVACIGGSAVSMQSPYTIRGMTAVASQGARIDVGQGCLISRDVLLYASKAHALYNVTDGARRHKETIVIGDRVWLGQGTRVLVGAEVGAGSVIGSYSVLAGRIGNNCAAAGNPCRVTTKNVFWTPQPSGENYYEALGESGGALPDFIKMTDD